MNESLAVACVALVLTACGGDDAMVPPDTGGGDVRPDAVGDVTAPELRDFRVTLQGPPVVTREVNAEDARVILPATTEYEATVRGQDDVTAAEELLVELLDADGMVITPSDQTFRNGLHRITGTIEPGQELRARVTDAAGNATTSEWRLVVPTLAEALVGAWELRFFDTDQMLVSRWTTTVATDGSWTESREDTGRELAGTLEVDGADIVMELRESSGGTVPEDSDPETIEERTTTGLYVDESFFATAPFTRTAMGTGGLTGTWDSARTIERAGAGGLSLAEEIAVTLTLSDDGTFGETRAVTDHASGSPVTTETTRSGTWEVVANENYSDAIADFIAFTTNSRDGATVDPPEEELVPHAVKRGMLLLAPRLAAE